MAIELVALLDGTVVPPTTPIIRGDDLGITRGDGVFEALLATSDGARGLEAHLVRLAVSADLLDLPTPDADGFRRAVAALLDAWDWAQHPEAIVRLFLSRGPEGGQEPTAWVVGAPLDEASRIERADGVAVVLLNRGFGAEVAELPWLLPGSKSLSYAINMAARRYAAAHGAQDVVFHSPEGHLLEGPTSAVVLDLDGVLVTPPPEGILASITLQELFDAAPDAGLSIRRGALTAEDFTRCRGAWLLSSGRLLAPITAVDGAPVPISPLDPAVRAALGLG